MRKPRKSTRQVLSGDPVALGASWDGQGTNFAIFSAHAERVELCLFDASGGREVERITLPEYTNEVWHGYRPGVGPGQLYGYRVYGPYDPEHGHRFNPNKLVLDPYARELVGDFRWSNAHMGYNVDAEEKDLSFSDVDSAPGMPKCRVVDPRSYDWGNDTKPAIPWGQTIFYETHTKGFTQLNPAIPENLRGTFEGMGDKATVDYIKSLGVTSVELLPIQSFTDDAFLQAKGLHNYWGYNTIGFFSPGAALLRAEWRQWLPQYGSRLPRCPHRGDPRCGLQPHRRGRNYPPLLDDAGVRGSDRV